VAAGDAADADSRRSLRIEVVVWVWLLLAESHPRRLFGSMVRRISALAVATG